MKSTIRILGVSIVLALILLGITSHEAKATFIIDPDPDGEKLFLVKADGVSSFTGDVGAQASGVLVSILADVNVDTGNGWANIKPSTDLTLGDLTFTPDDGTLFGDFSFRAQLDDAGDVTVKVWDSLISSPQTFTFTLPKNALSDRIGIISTDETIYKVEISNPSFNQVKEIDFSYAPGHAPVPEPATMLLLGSGLVGLAAYGRRKFFKK
jgi:hypothetical protein